MTTTAGHSFYIGPIGFFYNQVNDTGSWEPLVFNEIMDLIKILGTLLKKNLHSNLWSWTLSFTGGWLFIQIRIPNCIYCLD
jgi:hypothetical protein